MLEQKPGVNSEETVPALGVLQSISPQARPPTSSSCSLRESHPESPYSWAGFPHPSHPLTSSSTEAAGPGVRGAAGRSWVLLTQAGSGLWC